VGELSPDAWADLVAIPYTGSAGDSAAAIVNHTGDVPISIIDGEWVLRTGAQSQI